MFIMTNTSADEFSTLIGQNGVDSFSVTGAIIQMTGPARVGACVIFGDTYLWDESHSWVSALCKREEKEEFLRSVVSL